MNKITTTWLILLDEAMTNANDAGPVLEYAPDAGAFDKQFYAGYGAPEGPEVLAWTPTRVYFPVVYDGAEWLGSAPRDPDSVGQAHVGGW